MRKLTCSILCAALLSAVAAFAGQPAHAQENTIIPDNAVWGLSIDINKLWNSELGQQVERHLGQQADEDLDHMLHGLSNMLGLDLRRDLGRIVVFGSGFEPQDAAAVVEIGQAETNIEGLLLAADGYDSYTYGDSVVHSLIPDNEGEEKRVYLAVSPGASGLVVASHRKRHTEQLLDRVKAGHPLTSARELDDDRFARLWVRSIPADLFEDGAQSNLAAIITGLDLIARSGEMTSVDLTVTTNDAARARQLEQLINGGLAMLQLAAGDSPEAAALTDLTSSLEVQRNQGAAEVSLGWSIKTSEMTQLFNTLEELDQQKDNGMNLE